MHLCYAAALQLYTTSRSGPISRNVGVFYDARCALNGPAVDGRLRSIAAGPLLRRIGQGAGGSRFRNRATRGAALTHEANLWPAVCGLLVEFLVDSIEEAFDCAVVNICLYVFGKSQLEGFVAFRLLRESDEHLRRVDILG